MNNSPSDAHGQDELLLSALASSVGPDGKYSVLGAKTPQPNTAAGSIIDPHSFDLYGRPRVVTGWEATLYSLARPTVIGVAIGFALAIIVVATHTASPSQTQAGPDRLQVEAGEESP